MNQKYKMYDIELNKYHQHINREKFKVIINNNKDNLGLLFDTISNSNRYDLLQLIIEEINNNKYISGISSTNKLLQPIIHNSFIDFNNKITNNSIDELIIALRMAIHLYKLGECHSKLILEQLVEQIIKQSESIHLLHPLLEVVQDNDEIYFIINCRMEGYKSMSNIREEEYKRSSQLLIRIIFCIVTLLYLLIIHL